MDQNSNSNQPWFLSGSDVSRLVRDKKITAREVVESQLQRIEDVNKKINAIVADGSDDARETARLIDAGQLVAPNVGMTVTTKVNTDHLGYANDNGIRRTAESMSTKTAACIEGLLESGMAMVGRTNAPALSMRFHTDNELHGETLNPHGQHISCGGSSGGAAAAVAAGLCHVAQGNDVGGSVRWPAYCNGVIGLRPTIGRMVTGGTNSTLRGWSAANMATNGPIARTMEDLHSAFIAMNKPNWADPFWVPAPLEFPRSANPLRVALVTSDSIGLHSGVVAKVKEAGQILSNAGYVVEEVSPPKLDEMFSLWTTLGSVDINFGLIPMLPAINDAGLSQVFNDWAPAFADDSGSGFMRAHMLRDQVIRAWNEFFTSYPLVVLPGFAEPMMRRNQDREGGDSMFRVAELARYMLNIPALGIPAMSFPMGSYDGAPIGVQIAAHAWREDLIIEAGYAMEKVRGKVSPVDPQW
jgi:amidase